MATLKAKAPDSSSNKKLHSEISMLGYELLVSDPKIHISHLLVTGTGSYAAHKALDDFYNDVEDLADQVIEEYQGAVERLMDFPSASTAPVLKTKDQALDYIRDLRSRVQEIQDMLPKELSNIGNVLDEVKSLIDSTKYKLIFLS